MFDINCAKHLQLKFYLLGLVVSEEILRSTLYVSSMYDLLPHMLATQYGKPCHSPLSILIFKFILTAFTALSALDALNAPPLIYKNLINAYCLSYRQGRQRCVISTKGALSAPKVRYHRRCVIIEGA